MNKFLLLLLIYLVACAGGTTDQSGSLSGGLFDLSKDGKISILACLEGGGDITLSPENGEGLCLLPDKVPMPVGDL